jgi:hypothetical protein
LTASSDASVAAAATKQLATARDWKAHPLAQMAAEYQERQKNSPWARKPGDVVDPEAEQLAAAQSGMGDDSEVDNRPMKFVKGILLSSQCNANGSALIRTRVGKRILKLHARDTAHMQLVGGDAFDCGWKNRPVSINYRETSALEGDIVSLEVK